MLIIKKMVNKCGLLSVLIFFIVSTSVKAENNDEYVQNLVNQANEQKLFENSYWINLLHYKKNFFGYKSLIDDPIFFFAADGKKNPKSEMEETIKAFFVPVDDKKMHPSMKFIARFNWLHKKLNFDLTRTPINPFEKFNKYLDSLKPKKVFLVFPSGYINSPASMFGHTLLLIESEDKTRLLAKSVNYAAKTGETFGPAFAFKGLFGLYKGYFSFLPYYKKINEYNNGEMRDLWEYELNFSKEEIKNMLMHIIELENIYSDYYFLDENCSFNLLYLIEVARPNSNITDLFNSTVEPIDTIRVLEKKNFIDKKLYRPSLYTKLNYLKSKLSSGLQSYSLKVVNGEVADFSGLNKNISDEEKIIVCDLATEYLQFLAVKNEVTKTEYSKRLLKILSLRSSINGEYNIYEGINKKDHPEDSHRPSKITIGVGKLEEKYFEEINYRITNHQLNDTDVGLIKNSEIVFGDLICRFYNDDEKIKLQRFDVLSIVSLPPSDRFYINNCWKAKLGVHQQTLPDSSEKLSYYLDLAGGVSSGFFNDNLLFFILGGVESNFNSEYKSNSNIAGEIESGFIFTCYCWKSIVSARYLKSPFLDQYNKININVKESFALGTFAQLMFEYNFYNKYDIEENEYKISLSCYF